MRKMILSARASRHANPARGVTFAAVAILALACVACSSTQLTDAENQANALINGVTQACAGAQQAETTAQAAAKGGAADTVANISSYVNSACSTEAQIAAVAQNPGTVAWLNQLVADFNAAVGAQSAAAAPAS